MEKSKEQLEGPPQQALTQTATRGRGDPAAAGDGPLSEKAAMDVLGQPLLTTDPQDPGQSCSFKAGVKKHTYDSTMI